MPVVRSGGGRNPVSTQPTLRVSRMVKAVAPAQVGEAMGGFRFLTARAGSSVAMLLGVWASALGTS